MYVGTNSVVLETTFRGALLAPHASVRLATNHPTRRHIGVFFAKNLEVSPDVTVEFRPYWSYEVAIEHTASGAPGRLGIAAVTNAGDVLVDSRTNIVRVSAAGLMSNEIATDATRRTVIGEGATGYGYYEGEIFRRFRADGTLVADLPAADPGVARLIPGTLGTVLTYGTSEHKADTFEGFRIHSGGAVIDVAELGMLDVAVGPSHVVYTRTGETVAVDLAGHELWRKPFQLLDFAISEASAKLIGAYADGGPRVVHIDLPTGTTTSPFTPTSAPWAVEIAPDGEHSLLATKGRVATFRGGQLERDFALPFSAFASADIRDSGEVLIGGAGAGDQTFLLLLGPSVGMGQWLSPPGAPDVAAFRPFVEFSPRTPDFVAVQKAGLTRYSVTRSL